MFHMDVDELKVGTLNIVVRDGAGVERGRTWMHLVADLEDTIILTGEAGKRQLDGIKDVEDKRQKKIVMIGQTKFDGQIVRYLNIAKSLTQNNYKMDFVTLSGEQGKGVEILKASLAETNVGFYQVMLPELTQEEVEFGNDALPPSQRWNPDVSPPCPPSELFHDCILDGLVEFMVSRLHAANLNVDEVTPAWSKKIWKAMYEPLAELSPDAVLIANTGFAQDKMISLVCRALPSKPVVGFDLPNLFPPLGLSADFFLSPR